MSDYYFVLQEMSGLRTYMPLIKEFNLLGARSSFIVCPKEKYNSPDRHKDYLNKICLENKIATITFDKFTKNWKDKTVFSVEGKRIIDYDSEPTINEEENKVYSLPTQVEFLYHHQFQKKKKFKKLFQASKSICDYYKIQDENFWFSGDPKYNIELDSSLIKKKYGIETDKKIALFVRPEDPFGVPETEWYKILDHLRKLNFCIIIKSRGKHSISTVPKAARKADYVFEDYSWFPHDMMELIHISDVCINMDSTACMEMAMGDTPFLNYRVSDRPHVKAYAKSVGLTERVCNFMYNYGFCKDNDDFLEFKEFKQQIEYLIDEDHSDEFNRVKKEFLFDKSKTLTNIIISC
tara:strand:+ start:841 stop:1890 length:1050 start_codon:yes stop_codon:yes gene_type:complete